MGTEKGTFSLADFKVGDRWIDKYDDEVTIVAIVPESDHVLAVTYHENGRLTLGGAEIASMVRKIKPKRVRYVNVFDDGVSCLTRSDADNHPDINAEARIACVRVEFEVGQFDD